MNRSRLAKRAAATVLGLAVAAFLFTVASPSAAPAPVASAASVDYFLKIEGVDGESTDAGHKDHIEISSWSWGVSNSTTVGSGGAGAGKVQFQDFHFTKRVDKSTPYLFLACASGEHIRQAVLYAARPVKGEAEDYYRITLSDVTCTSLSQQGSQDDLPMESISFNYGKIEMEYLPKQSTTWLQAGWDIAKNVKI